MARSAGLADPLYTTEPEAAAAHYASTRPLGEGDVLAVYDLGGGTFDATVLRRTSHGFEIVGTPEGIERLGGADFDDAIFAHVNYLAGGALTELDHSDPKTVVALARLRQDCTLAKEALSVDVEATIPVFLPNRHFDVTLTRGELEGMIRAPIESTIGTLDRVLRAAQVDRTTLAAVLLVGGSSRIPLVAQMVSEAFGRPTVVGAHPKHSVALGAALLAEARRRKVAGARLAGADAGRTAAGSLVTDSRPADPRETPPSAPGRGCAGSRHRGRPTDPGAGVPHRCGDGSRSLQLARSPHRRAPRGPPPGSQVPLARNPRPASPRARRRPPDGPPAAVPLRPVGPPDVPPPGAGAVEEHGGSASPWRARRGCSSWRVIGYLDDPTATGRAARTGRRRPRRRPPRPRRAAPAAPRPRRATAVPIPSIGATIPVGQTPNFVVAVPERPAALRRQPRRRRGHRRGHGGRTR